MLFVSVYWYLIIHQIFSLSRDWSKRITWANISQLKLGNVQGYYWGISKDIPQFLKPMDSTHNSLNLAAKICLDICPWTLSVPRTLSVRSRKTVHFSEQIMSADKYRSIFLRQMKAIVYIVPIASCLFLVLLVFGLSGINQYEVRLRGLGPVSQSLIKLTLD